MKFLAEAQRAPWNGNVEVFLGLVDRSGKRFNLKPLPDSSLEDPGDLLDPVESDFVARGPTLTLGTSEAQALLDSLYHAGLRPTYGSDAAGVVAAKDEHIQDLRRVAFGRDEVEHGPTLPPGSIADLHSGL